MGWRFAADCNGYGVNRLFAIPSRDDQFTASRGGTSVLQLLLNAAAGRCRHRNRNLCIASNP